MAALEPQKRRRKHHRLLGDVHHIPLDDRHGPLQTPELPFMRRRALLHAHHAIEQAPTGQTQHGENSHGDHQFQQGEPTLLTHHEQESSQWRGAGCAHAPER
ncbi:hypothetical protein D3C80_1523500 [compost metagenome]